MYKVKSIIVQKTIFRCSNRGRYQNNTSVKASNLNILTFN